MVGGVNLHWESNPIPARDSQRAQTNLVCTRTQWPHRDWGRTVFECLCGGIGQWRPASVLGALNVAVLAWDLLKEVTIFFITSTIVSVHFSSVAQFCPTLCSSMDWHARPPCPSSIPGVYSNPCPLSQWCHTTISYSVVPSPLALNLSQHQGLFKWVSSFHQVAKILELLYVVMSICRFVSCVAGRECLLWPVCFLGKTQSLSCFILSFKAKLVGYSSFLLTSYFCIPSLVMKRTSFLGVVLEGQEKAMAPHSSTLTWKIPWMEEPGRLQSMGSWRVRHDWVTLLSIFTFMHWRRKWQPTPVFLPGESQGQRSLVGCRLWGLSELGTTEAT